MGAVQFPLEEEYKKNTGISPADIKKFREWLETQPHLPKEHITDLELILAFHCCDRSTEVSKQVLDLNLTLRTLFTNFYKNRIVDAKTLNTFTYYGLFMLEKRARDDSAVLYTRLMNYDAKNFVFADAVRAVLFVVDLCQYEEGTWPGLMIAIDLENVTLSHVARLDIQTVQQLLYFLQEAMLLKVKGLHFLNAPSFMDKIMMILRPFIKKELMDVIVIHQVGSRTIDKYIPIEALPKEAGGEFKTYQQARDFWIEKIKNAEEFFLEENKKRVNESLRPGKPKTITDIFGSVKGSFKKLDID